jgi:hypothetical protein
MLEFALLGYTGKEATKLAKLFKQIDKNINIGLKTNNKINNIIGNSIENYNKFEKRGVNKLTCNSSNKSYIGRTKRNFFKPDSTSTGETSPHQRGSLRSLNIY